MQIQRSSFGLTRDGRAVDLFSITNTKGSTLRLTNFGAILTAVEVPDRTGKMQNVTLGFPELAGYLNRHPFFGATVGRFCNRIAAGRFALEGQSYQVAVNKEPNHIHGGILGFDKQIWQAEEIRRSDGSAGVQLNLTSPDGQEGYPGTLKATVEYSWNESNELLCRFQAVTNRPTIINMTNHAYWNLAGCDSGTIEKHYLQLNCREYLEVDSTLIPSGKILSVVGTPLDFLQFQTIGSRLGQLPATKGYDHCFVIDGKAGNLRTCALVEERYSGRTLEVLTTQPGVQLYTGNHLASPYPAHSGFCLETQHYPDSPNHAHFPTTQLNPGDTFQESTIYRFGTMQ